MTKHQKVDALPNLNRRSFIVGTAATGLVLGYAVFPNTRIRWPQRPPISSRQPGMRSATTAKS